MTIDADRDGFRAVYASNRDAVWRYVRRRGLNETAAEDVVSEVFAIAWRRRAATPPDPGPWLYGIARRVLANHHRAAGRREALVDRVRRFTVDREPDHADRIGVRQDLAAGLARLGEADRELLLLAAWEGLDNDELAVALGCRPGTAAVRLSRARSRLRAQLDPPTGGTLAGPPRTEEA
ncbi:RNA polymerase sigma factor [Patulibacter defluvii]|uniref:RNA polymerase sigma factor n=1 Tax=Patulibacter defluvii TaxID=3095358 RepID=UPI002A763449|nr:sigma-70 family RNA polymerase sigma factor [Patulibacter sp. DM4]